MSRLAIAPLAVAILLAPTTTRAQPIAPVSASGAGAFTNDPGLIIDDVFPAEGSFYASPETVHWVGLVPTFTIDLGDTYVVTDAAISVDNNDTYAFEASIDGGAYTPLFALPFSAGEVVPVPGGMETATSFPGPEFESAIDFRPALARFIRVSVTEGDNFYSIGETQFFGTRIPEPTTAALAVIAVLGLAGRKAR